MSNPLCLESLLLHLFQLSAPRGNSSPAAGESSTALPPSVLRLAAAAGRSPSEIDRGLSSLARQGLVNETTCRLTLSGLAVAAALGAARRRRSQRSRLASADRGGRTAGETPSASCQGRRAAVERAGVQRAA